MFVKLILLNTMFSRFIYVVVYVRTYFLFKTKYYFIMWWITLCSFILHGSVGCFLFLAIVSNAAVGSHVQIWEFSYQRIPHSISSDPHYPHRKGGNDQVWGTWHKCCSLSVCSVRKGQSLENCLMRESVSSCSCSSWWVGTSHYEGVRGLWICSWFVGFNLICCTFCPWVTTFFSIWCLKSFVHSPEEALTFCGFYRSYLWIPNTSSLLPIHWQIFSPSLDLPLIFFLS